MKIVFMGTPDFSVVALNALVDAGHEVVCAYSQPPRPAGRGKKDRKSAVQTRAEELGIPVRYPTSLKDAQAQEEFAALGADIAVVVAYGLILPQAILDLPAHGCLNIHASLLPRWRGAAPIQRAIMSGDAQTGVTIMQMEAGLDTGPMLAKRAIDIEPGTTAGALHDTLASLGGQMIVETLENLANLTAIPQPEDGVSYAEKIDKAEARIDWNRPAIEVCNHICGISPFPGCFVDIEGARVKLLSAEVCGTEFPEGAKTPGTVLEGFTVQCNPGSVRVTRAQKQGKKPMSDIDFLRGFTLPKSI